MTIGKKLYIVCGMALLCSLILGTVAVYSMSQMSKALYAMSHAGMRKKYLSDQISLELSEQLSSYRGMLARGYMPNSVAWVDKYRDQFNAQNAAMEKTSDELSTLLLLPKRWRSTNRSKMEPLLSTRRTKKCIASSACERPKAWIRPPSWARRSC